MRRSGVLLVAILAAAALAASAILGACGGGGGGSAAPQTSTNVTIKGKLDTVGSFQIVSKSRFHFALWDYVNPVGLAIAGAAGRPVHTIIAVGSDGSHHEGTVGVDGSFSVSVPPGASYVVTMLAGVTVSGTIQADSGTSMDTFPITTSTLTTLNLGTVTLASGVSTTASGSNAILASLGTSSNIANVYGIMDDFMVRLSNVDADANGVADYKEVPARKYNFFVSYHFKYSSAPGSGQTFTYLSSLSSPSYGDPAVLAPTSYQYTLWENPIGSALISRPGATWTGAVLTLPAAVNSSATATACSINDLPNDPDFPGRFVDFFCGGSANSPTTPPPGDYLITSGSTTLIYLKNVKTQTINPALDNMFFPVGRISSSGGVLTASWKWMKKSGGIWVAATDAEIQAVMSIMLWGLFDNTGGPGHNKDYNLPLTATGTFTSGTAAALGFTPSRTGFTWVDKAGFAYALGDY